MTGDNFRAVDSETAAWAMKQHLQMVAVDIGLRKMPTTTHTVPKRVAEVINRVLTEHGVSSEAFLNGNATKRVYRARQAAFKALRAMDWGGSAPSYSQIARWCNRHPSSVHHYFEHVAPLEAKGGAA